MAYTPPFSITNDILNMVAEISGLLGRLEISNPELMSPQLRRGNRIKTIQASLAIENNTLTLEQVTSVIDGKRVLGLPHEIQEVTNAFKAYEHLSDWSACSVKDLLEAHGQLMYGLVEQSGQFRNGGVGIYRGETLIHMAPPADRVPVLVAELLDWVERTDTHSLITSGVFHYEFEFIHPFSDGNGRMGRLWQTLLLSRWQPLFAYLPVESVIKEQQEAYYQALSDSDKQSEATPFISFILNALLIALKEVGNESSPSTDSRSISAEDYEYVALLNALNELGQASHSELMGKVRLKHRPTFRKKYLLPALEAGYVEMLYPDSPKSPKQKYLLSESGRALFSKR
ncbi:cell filamentation protein Fic [Vibrio sp. HA2012]|uniref:Fic family protein n=1 Tax=Vibrio sp. HA2012 TaxID=1971595 RepID=UPI000C2CBE53|nr:Fic family protein [Vibrio sp. HA2012]PJC85871.1 cell filamentation protein Fic [Vibrio sp. HA2012]